MKCLRTISKEAIDITEGLDEVEREMITILDEQINNVKLI
jgi:hypothetical protein